MSAIEGKAVKLLSHEPRNNPERITRQVSSPMIDRMKGPDLTRR